MTVIHVFSPDHYEILFRIKGAYVTPQENETKKNIALLCIAFILEIQNTSNTLAGN